MFKYHCLNPIAQVGLNKFSDQYEKTEKIEEADEIGRASCRERV